MADAFKSNSFPAPGGQLWSRTENAASTWGWDSEHLWNRLHQRARPPAIVENWLPQPSYVQLRAAPANLPFFLLWAIPTAVN
jgi:hypothetical protein